MNEKIENVEYVMRIFDAFTMAVHSYNLDVQYVRQCCFDIFSSLFYSYINKGSKQKEIHLECLANTLVGADVEEACEITRQFFIKLLGQKEENHDVIVKAKLFINQHLAENLSVALIAEKLYLSANYFSRLFKRVEKEGCNEYIVRMRMEKASELLTTTSINTGKIAVMVGYNDSNYFSIAFKKFYGISPNNYRKKQLQ